MKKIILFTIIVLATNIGLGQDQQKYSEHVKKAQKLYKDKEYLKSAQKYSEAFVALGNKGYVNDRYDAACSWALAKQVDSSFVQLFKIALNADYANLSHITADSDLNILHTDKRWNEVIAIVKSNKDKIEAKLDKLLIATLDTIYQEDQKYREQIDEIQQKYGSNSDEVKNLWKIIEEKDSINLIKVKLILDERGWLGADVVGGQGNSTLFLVIQHSDLSTQEKYLPMMREAVKKGNAKAGSLALLEDRVALRQGRKQIYGSQIGGNPETGYYVLPLEDPDNVDKRRKEVGLPNLEDYVSNWGIVWDVEQYKKDLPELEERFKIGVK